MQENKVLKKTGKWMKAAWTALLLGPALALAAGSVTFKAEVDRDEIGEDESIALTFTVSSDTSGASPTNLRFNAPDFDVVNEYQSSSVISRYDSGSGRFTATTNQKVTKVLHPRKTGALKISGLQVTVGGAVHTSPDLTIQVRPGGAGTPPPSRYGGGGVGLRGAGKKTSGPPVMIRAEIDKEKIFKGEQLIVSYYLYTRVRTFNIEVTKFPDLKGFLREELEMPVMGTRLDSERVMLDGTAYSRSLLVRYAAYPLQEGKLRVDSLGLKYSYYANSGMGDDDDVFQFFQNFAARMGNDRSEAFNIEVQPLPSDGRPASFTGGVGDFNVTSAVNKYELRANEALTLTVKVEGRGNLAAIGEPKAKWPGSVELYDSKGVAKSGKGGVGEKVFEFLLIPRSPGKLQLPGLEFSFFDPRKKAYVTRTTEPVEINVLEPAPGSPVVSPRISGQSAVPADPVKTPQKADEIRPLKSPGTEASTTHWMDWLYWGAMAAAGLFVGWMGFSSVQTWNRKRLEARNSDAEVIRARNSQKKWQTLQQWAKAAESGLSSAQLSEAYELICTQLFEAMDTIYGLGARSLPRARLHEALVLERGMPEAVWERAGRILEYAETVRFAAGVGVVSEQAARKDLKKWVNEAEAVARLILRQNKAQ